MPESELDVERNLLGAVLTNCEEALGRTIESRLSASDFTRQAHAEIYSVMLELYDSGGAVDMPMVNHALEKRGSLSAVGGASYILELSNHYGVAASSGHYAKVIIERAMLRRLAMVSGEISEKCRSNPPSVSDLLDEAEAAVYKIRDDRSSSSLVPAAERMDDVFSRIADIKAMAGAGLSGIPTGFSYLDYLTGGFQPTDLVILGGRPGMGKTSLALNFALAAAIPSMREDKKHLASVPVAVFSLEMGNEQLLQRLLCQIGKHDLLGLRTGRITDQELEKLTKSSMTLRNAPIFIDDTAGIRPVELRAKVRRLQSQLRMRGLALGMIVVDYLQLMRPNERHNNREQEISEISGSLKALAKEMSVPVITLSQLKRSDELEPSLSDLRESGAIEQDADMVFFVLRKELIKRDDPELKGKAEVRLRKHRNGPTGMINLRFLQESSCFAPDANYHEFEGG
jgi:replicative DNA helicase